MATQSKKNSKVVSISPEAYTKIILHAVRCPTSQIHGILIGTVSSADTIVENVAPVFHSSPTKPILDMALRLAESHFGTTEDSSNGNKKGVIGWYTCNERMGDDDRANILSMKIASGISAGLSSSSASSSANAVATEATLLLLQNSNLLHVLSNQSDNTQHALVSFERDERKQWIRALPTSSLKTTMTSGWSNVLDIAKKAVAKESSSSKDDGSLDLFDFEDHLSSSDLLLEKDWLRNPKVDQFVAQQL